MAARRSAGASAGGARRSAAGRGGCRSCIGDRAFGRADRATAVVATPSAASMGGSLARIGRPHRSPLRVPSTPVASMTDRRLGTSGDSPHGLPASRTARVAGTGRSPRTTRRLRLSRASAPRMWRTVGPPTRPTAGRQLDRDDVHAPRDARRQARAAAASRTGRGSWPRGGCAPASGGRPTPRPHRSGSIEWPRTSTNTSVGCRPGRGTPGRSRPARPPGCVARTRHPSASRKRRATSSASRPTRPRRRPWVGRRTHAPSGSARSLFVRHLRPDLTAAR